MKYNYKIRNRGELGNFILELSTIDNQIVSRHWWWIEQLQVKNLKAFQPVWSISIEGLASFKRTRRWMKKKTCGAIIVSYSYEIIFASPNIYQVCEIENNNYYIVWSHEKIRNSNPISMLALTSNFKNSLMRTTDWIHNNHPELML